MPTDGKQPATYDEWLEQVRAEAGARAFVAEKARIGAIRRTEETMRRRGEGGRYADLTLADIERTPAVEHEAMCRASDEYRARVEFLRREARESIEHIQAVEDAAISNAILCPPPRIRMLERHERERGAFLRGREETELSDADAKAYRALVEKQSDEISGL